MKKRFSVLFLFFFLCIAAFAEKIGVVSFNIQGFGPQARQYKHDYENKKWLDNIATILINSKASLIFLQEVPIEKNNNEKTIVRYLTSKLGNSWLSYDTLNYSNSRCKYGLDNVILYDSSRLVSHEDDSYYINFKDSNCDYKFVKNNAQVARFYLSGNETESFFAINVHMPFSDKNGTNEDEKWADWYLDYDYLINMFSYLSETYSNRILIGGDFNSYGRESLVKGDNTARDFKDAIVDGESSPFFNPADCLKTSISTSNQKNKIILANAHDHFIVSNINISEEMHHCIEGYRNESQTAFFQVIKVGRNSYTTCEDVKKFISDHMPIAIELEFEN